MTGGFGIDKTGLLSAIGASLVPFVSFLSTRPNEIRESEQRR
jgi:hypothetical protein